MLDTIASIYRRMRSRIDTFQEARAGFETVTRRLSQAMLNTYWDYVYMVQVTMIAIDETSAARDTAEGRMDLPAGTDANLPG